jgi:AMMECR1 domain-containing protein
LLVFLRLYVVKDFLEELSLKAGLSKDAWKDCNILYYNIESVKEK